MRKFKEQILQHIWKSRQMSPGCLKTVSGKSVTILFPGELNTDSGPDFFNAQVVIDGLHLAGNIELHIRTSDWLRHKHQFDAAYDRIILHVVFHHDVNLPQNVNNGVEVLELENVVKESTLSLYEGLLRSTEQIPCLRQLRFLDDEVFVSWLEQLALTRLHEKVNAVGQLFETCRGDYAQTFYLLFLKSFGFKINALPFELLGKNLPVNLLLRHADKPIQLEALLLGSAGFLNDQFEDPYLRKLQNEYSFLQGKYALVALQPDLFKFSRLRPANFPTVRLLQLARLIHLAPDIFRAPQLYLSGEELLGVMKKSAVSDTADSLAEIKARRLPIGTASLQSLIINAFAPFQFFYGNKLGQLAHKTVALQLIKTCAPENNYKTRQFQPKKHLNRSAFLSQGMIQLYDHYCEAKRCLQCEVGEHLLSA